MRRTLTTALALTLSVSSLAFAESWTITPGSQSMSFSFPSPAGFTNATLNGFDAEIKFDPADLGASSVVATIDPASFASDQGNVTSEVRGSDWFDTRNYEAIVFTGSEFESLGGDSYSVSGELQIRDLTSPFSFEFDLAIDGDAADFSAEFPLNRLFAGLGQRDYPNGSQVPEEITINLSFSATK